MPTSSTAGFTHVVPLGLSCRVTYQMRTRFRCATRYPFDWWITPIDGLARYLADPDPDRLFAPGALEERIENGWPSSIASREFGFQLFHEFPRQKEAPAVPVVSPRWQAHIGAVRERHERRMHTLLSTDEPGNRVLFVRHQLGPDTTTDSAASAVDALWQSLARQWTRAEVHLLLINLPAVEVPSTRVRQLRFEDPPGPDPESWRGDDARWALALHSAGIVPARDGEPLSCPPSPGERG